MKETMLPLYESTNGCCLQDHYVSIHMDHWKNDKPAKFPSVLQQLCITAEKIRTALEANYYHPLFVDEQSIFDPIESITTSNISRTPESAAEPLLDDNNYHVDVIDLTRLGSLIAEQQQQDRAQEGEFSQPTQPMQEEKVVHVHRTEIKRLFNLRTPEKIGEAFKRFFIALKHADSHAAIRPFYSEDAKRIPALSDATQVQRPEAISLQKYHHSWAANQKYSLTGRVVIESSLEFPELVRRMEQWLVTNHYEIFLSASQTSELVRIGVLIKTSFTLYRNELLANTKSIVENLPEEEQFEFTFQKDTWYCSQNIDVIFVAVAKHQITNGMRYFCRMYDGVNTKVPMGQPLVFVPTYQIQLSDEAREKIGYEQRRFRDSEVAIFVHGFRDLNTQVKLIDGSSVSIRSLLLSLRTNDPNCPRHLLFHGADRCPQQEGWIYLKYNREDERIVKKRVPRLAYDFAQLLEAGESERAFINSDVGLEFGGEVRQKYSAKYPKGKSVTPVPTDPAILSYFQDIVGKMQNAPPKRAHEASQLTVHGHSDPFRTPSSRPYPPGNPNNSTESSYASRATSAMYTSTTRINGPSNTRASPNSIQTRTESIVVIEQYERRFVHMEGRLSTVEKSVNKSERMLDSLLRHHGINVDTIEIDTATNTTASLSGPMELEHSGTMEGGTKRLCYGNNQSELTARENSNNHDE